MQRLQRGVGGCGGGGLLVEKMPAGSNYHHALGMWNQTRHEVSFTYGLSQRENAGLDVMDHLLATGRLGLVCHLHPCVGCHFVLAPTY